MEGYQKYKCYNTYKSIENAEKFLEKLNNPQEYNFEIDKNKNPFIHLIKKFPELKELTLVSNKIEDISPLFFCEFLF